MATRLQRLSPLVGAALVVAAAARAAPAAEQEAPATAADGEPTRALAEACLLRKLHDAPDDARVGDLRQACEIEARREDESLVLARRERERVAEEIPSLLTPYKRNYILPLSYAADPNEEPFRDETGSVVAGDELGDVEAKFQLSLKLSLAHDLLLPDDRVYFGFTTVSYWQAYNWDVSAPFRETNYEPELFWSTPMDWRALGLDATLLSVGVSHQSNGRGGTLSRSWNRVYADLTLEKHHLVFNLRPWWRIPEDEKDDPLDANGDDNPDIEKYMGHFELTTTYRRGTQEWSIMLRNNLSSDNKGAVQLEWGFPLWGDVRGFAQYFSGYGESLIDYDARMERIGVGILLTDLL